MKYAVVVFAIIGIGAAVYFGTQNAPVENNEPKKDQPNITDNTETKKDVKKREKVDVDYDAKVEKLKEKKVVKKEKPKPKKNSTPVELTEQEKRRVEMMKFGMQMAKGFFENENMQKMMKDGMTRRLTQRYKAIFDELDLSDDERKKVAALLADRQMGQMKAMYEHVQKEGVENMQKMMTEPDAMADMLKALDDSKADFNSDLKTSLGDKYEDFHDYDKKSEARQRVDSMNNWMLRGDDKLSSDQQKQLTDIIYEDQEAKKQKLYNGEADFNDMTNNDSLFEEAGKVLNEKQMETFKRANSNRMSNFGFGGGRRR